MKLKVFCERAGYFIINLVEHFLVKNPMIEVVKCEVTPLPTHFTIAATERSERSQADESLVRPYVFVALWYEELAERTKSDESLTADKAMEELFDL